MLERGPAAELTDDEALRREKARQSCAAPWPSCPSEQSKVIQLAYFGGFSHSEIAEMLGMPLGRSRAGCGWAWRRSGRGWRRGSS